MTHNKNIVLIWYTQKRIVNNLISYEKNPRKLSKLQEDNLKRSLEKFNLVEIPVIDTDNKIIAGHQRLKIMQLLGRGAEEIDVRVPNRKLTEEEYKSYLLTSNAVTGDWDFELLKEFDGDILKDVGFDEDILADIWDSPSDLSIDTADEAVEIQQIKHTDIQVGDTILLGNHKLVCGDSNDPNVVARLFNKDEKASMIYCDPIYNIDLDYDKGLGGKQNYGVAVNDKRSEEEYTDFLKKNISNALSVAHPNCHVFYWNTEQHIYILQNLYKELDIQNKRVCLWIKNGHNPTPKVAFNKCYEPCIYGTRGKPYLYSKEQSLTEVLNHEIGTGNESLDEINIWATKRLSSSEYQHATSKPPELHYKAIRRCTKPNDIIFDSFGGSGSTLIACEQLNRRAYIVELSPVFCELIIQKFKRITGKDVTIIKPHETT